MWLDLVERRHMTVTYSWSSGMYRPTKRPAWASFVRNPLLAQQALENNEHWSDVLDDPGTAFTHPRRGKLRLSDLFVYPDLTRRSLNPADAKNDRRIDSSDVLDFVASKKKVVFTGPSDSGKTSLAKRLYMDLKQRQGSVPILVTGKKLHKVKARDYLRVFVMAFEEQYTSSQAERYRQLEPSRRLVIVDDFEQARLSARGRAALMEATTRFAGSILIFADELFTIDRLSQTADDREDGLGEGCGSSSSAAQGVSAKRHGKSYLTRRRRGEEGGGGGSVTGGAIPSM